MECVNEVLDRVTVSVICNGTDVYSNVTYLIKNVNNTRELVLVPQHQECNISIVFSNDVGSSEPFIVPLGESICVCVMYSSHCRYNY